ncbi:MAG TPA: plastocyanin/azurin family copper-binding protein [Gemmatimonadaceae bacterium]|nr:plastocyanin/azurin family copper-binding protein [Gemmatimonadaceae bacterium]
MPFRGLALLVSALFLAACASGEQTQQQAAADAPATQEAGTIAGARITGQTHTVRMLGDERGYRYDPVNLTIRQGDGVRFIMVSTPPHNVEFRSGQIPAGAEAQLAVNMENAVGMMGPMMLAQDEEYTISFANVPPGVYNYVCTPHEAMDMRGVITVQ